MIVRRLATLLALLLTVGSTRASECRALIVAGDPGESNSAAERFTDWATRWKSALQTKCGFKAENIRMLRSPGKPGDPNPVRPLTPELSTVPAAETATLENVKSALATLVKESRADDQVVLVLIGDGYDSQGLSKLCLPGKDLTDTDVARELDGLKAKLLICIDTAAASAAFTKTMMGKNRITITAAATIGQRSQTYFCEFFLRALETGNTNLLEAFNHATLETTHFYQNQFAEKKVTTVHGKDFQALYKKFYPERELAPGGAEPQKANNNQEVLDGWYGRRVLTEVAGLEDNGDGVPSTIFEDGKEPAPLPTKDGEGNIARTVVLGKP